MFSDTPTPTITCRSDCLWAGIQETEVESGAFTKALELSKTGQGNKTQSVVL